MTDRVLLDRAGVARKLGISVERLYRHLRQLERDGFPAPVFGRMSGARWDSVAIDRWLDMKLPGSPPAAGDHDDWAERLDGRVALVAAGLGD